MKNLAPVLVKIHVAVYAFEKSGMKRKLKDLPPTPLFFTE
jgi:hypothetical protein